MSNPRSFSVGVDKFLDTIRPYRRSESYFPQSLKDSDASRRKNNESLHTWFVRLVDRFCQGDAKIPALEDRLAVFARCSWEKNNLVYANIQTLHCECDLEEYYLNDEAQAVYLRLDFDLSSFGEPFSHPLPHIQLEGNLSARFPLEGESGNIVLDYIEFLYRNFEHAKWLEWVERIWNDRTQQINATNLTLDTIFQAFREGQLKILQENETVLLQLKGLLRKTKDELFTHHIQAQARTLLMYP